MLPILWACTEPAPPAPLVGEFSLAGAFESRVQQTFPCNSNGCTIKYDTMPITGIAAGKITFDTLFVSIQSSPVTLNLGQCDYCLVSLGSTGHAWRAGDSVKVIFGPVNPSLQLHGVYRGDSISGRIVATQSGTSNDTYSGTFVAKRP